MSSESKTLNSEDTGVAASLSGNDKLAFEEISSRGSMLQSELWKVLDVSSRTGSRIAKRLTDKDAIRREKTVVDGNTTFKLVPLTVSEVSKDGNNDEDDNDNDNDNENPLTATKSLDDRIVSMVRAQGELLEETVVQRIDEPVEVVYEHIDKALSEGRIQQSVTNVYGRDRRQLVV